MIPRGRDRSDFYFRQDGRAWCSRGYMRELQHSQGQKSPGPTGLRLKSGPAVLHRLPIPHVLCGALRLAGPEFSQQRETSAHKKGRQRRPFPGQAGG